MSTGTGVPPNAAPSRHLVCRAEQARFLGPPGWAPAAAGFRRWSAVDDQVGVPVGAVHTGFGICELEPGGELPGHVHAFEQSFFVLEGEVVLTTPEGAFRVGRGGLRGGPDRRTARLAQRGRDHGPVGGHAGAAAPAAPPRGHDAGGPGGGTTARSA